MLGIKMPFCFAFDLTAPRLKPCYFFQVFVEYLRIVKFWCDSGFIEVLSGGHAWFQYGLICLDVLKLPRSREICSSPKVSEWLT